MLIVLGLYAALTWLLIFKLKLFRWGWGSGTIVVLCGAGIFAVFLALFNHLTPSGSATVVARVVEITPNVAGQITELTVKPNEPVKAGAVLFRIDPKPFQYRVSQLEASLAQARQQVRQLKVSYEQATANVEGLSKQASFNARRLSDMQQLNREQALSAFRAQDSEVQYEVVSAQLEAAKAAQQNAKLAMESEIGGVNTTVAQIEAQLGHAAWELAQTTISAPADGYVSIVALAVGDRALPTRAVMSFILTDEISIVGMFSPNGFQTIKPGALVKLVLDSDPGRVHSATILTIPEGIGQGQVAVSGVLARAGSIGGAKAYPAVISVPNDFDHRNLRLGMSGSATVFSEHAGVIGLLMSVLVWISSYSAYL